MPRKRKTQPVQVPTGMPYGQGEQMAAMQKAIPLPRATTPQDLVQPEQGAGGPPPTGGPPPLDAAMAAAQAMPGPGAGLLAAGGGEPLTSGLDIGAGPGSEVLRFADRSDLFHEMAVITGDPKFLRLAQQARLTR